MSSSAIDQILQIAPPVRSANEPVRQSASDRPAFQDHLERATTTKALPPENTETIDADHEDSIASDQQHDATASQEDENLVAADSAAAGEDIESNQEAEQDAVEISGAAILLDDIEDSTENEVVIAQEVSQSAETDSDNPDSEEDLNTKSENVDDRESAEKSAALTESKTVPTSTGHQKQEDEKTNRSDEPAEEVAVQPHADSKTQQELTGESIVDAQKKSQLASKAILKPQTEQTEQTATKEQPVQQLVQTKVPTEGQGSDSPADRKKAKQDANPQSTATSSESSALPEEPSLLAAENRPTVAASTPAPEATSPTSLTPTNLGGEVTNVSSHSNNNSTAVATDSDIETEPVPTADRARFVNRVGGAIRAAQNRDGEIRLQLRPAELGTLRIEISVKQGVLTAHLEAETSAARTILLDNLPALRERLAEQEIRIEKFDVDVRDEGRQQPDNPGTEDRKSNRPQQESNAEHQNKNQAKQAIQAASGVTTPSTHVGSLDISI